MICRESGLAGVIIVEPQVHGDTRGWFLESYSERDFRNAGIPSVFIQDNHSYSARRGTLRGLHFQAPPMAQSKLVRCTRGAILDVAVDIRKGSPNYLKWVKVELSSDNHRQLFIPKGFAHGFAALTDDVEIQYKVDEYYSAECDRSIRFDDPEIGVEWGVEDPVLSEKDRLAPRIRDLGTLFEYRFGG